MGIYTPNIIDFGRKIKPLRHINWGHGVLLRSTNWLGDLVMTLPATYQLKQLLPVEIPLRVLCKKGLAAIWHAAPWIDGVVPMAGNHISAEEAQFVRAEHYGVGVVLPNSFGSAWDIWRCGIPQRIGRRGRFRWLLLTDTIAAWPRGENAGNCHQLSYYLELMRLFGNVQYNAQCPPLRVDSAYASSLNISRADGWVALAPGAAYGPAKQWPVENYIAVAKACMERFGRRVVVVGAAKEAQLGAQIASAVPGVLDLTGKTSLPQLMSVLANCALAVANDSGTMHLAAALGTQGIALFASTDPVATGPLGAKWHLEIADVACRPCLKRECPFADAPQRYACMAQLPAERVIRLIEAMR